MKVCADFTWILHKFNKDMDEDFKGHLFSSTVYEADYDIVLSQSVLSDWR